MTTLLEFLIQKNSHIFKNLSFVLSLRQIVKELIERNLHITAVHQCVLHQPECV